MTKQWIEKNGHAEGTFLSAIMDVSPMFEAKVSSMDLSDCGSEQSEQADDLYERCLACVSEERRERAQKLKNHNDRCRSVGAAVLLNVAVGRYLTGMKRAVERNEMHVSDNGCENADGAHGLNCEVQKVSVISLHKALDDVKTAFNLPVVYGEKGKPEFDTGAVSDLLETYFICMKHMENEDEVSQTVVSDFFKNKTLHFNIAHAGKYVACAVSDRPVGIDIEGARKVKESVAKRYFSEKEQASIVSDEDFFRIWTFKEAYGKYTGEGLVPVLGISEADVKDKVCVTRYDYDGFQVCVVTDKTPDS